MSRVALICVVRGDVDEICRDFTKCGEHYHITRAEALEMETNGLVEWIRPSVPTKGGRGIVRLMNQHAPIRDLSAKVGVTLVKAAEKGEWWARMMLSEIRGEHSASLSDVNPVETAELAPIATASD